MQRCIARWLGWPPRSCSSRARRAPTRRPRRRAATTRRPKAYDLGDFKRAVEGYKAAYEAKPDPVLLYNIAQSYRLAKDFEQAVFFYRSYMRRLPDAPNRADVEARVALLEKQLEMQKEAAGAPFGVASPGTPPPPTAPQAKEPAPAPAPAGAATLAAAPEEHVADAPPTRRGWLIGVVIGVAAVVIAGVVIAIAVAEGGSQSPSTHFATVTF